jgi:hypothetical protein
MGTDKAHQVAHILGFIQRQQWCGVTSLFYAIYNLIADCLRGRIAHADTCLFF